MPQQHRSDLKKPRLDFFPPSLEPEELLVVLTIAAGNREIIVNFQVYKFDFEKFILTQSQSVKRNSQFMNARVSLGKKEPWV